VTGQRRPPEWLLVAVGALLVSGAVTLGSPAGLRADQHAYNLLVVKTLQPELFQRDPLYRHDPSLLHVPLFIALHARLTRWLGGGPETALAWLAWPMGALYLGGHYALFRAVSGSAAAAALAAVSALTVRNALGGEFWGFEGVRSAATRTIVAGLTPLVLLAFLRWRTRPSFPAFFLGLGLLVSAHPPSAIHLAQVTAIAHVWLGRFRARPLAEVGAGIALFTLGALPYAEPFLAARDNVADPASLALARQALDHRFPYLFYPIAPAALLSVAFHLALPVGLWAWWRRRHPAGQTLHGLSVIAVVALAAGLGGLAVIQAAGVWLERPYVDVQQLRVVRLAYPLVLCGFALVYARLLARATWRARTAVAILFVASLVPPASVIHAFGDEQRAAVKAALGMARPRPPSPGRAGDPVAVPALYDWARRATPPSALFLTQDDSFRVATHRSITGTFKDGAFQYVAGSRPFTEWYRSSREVEACRGVRGRGCWFELARRRQVDYAIVDPGLTETGSPADFERVWERGGFSVWRRL
jgi:hypothetical protein